MGLDSYFKQPDGDDFVTITLDFDTRPNLIGGMFSSHGEDGSFRGKCYNGVIETLTGMSLYEEHIENDKVIIMTENLRCALYEETLKEYKILREWLVSEDNYFDLQINHIVDLHRVFDAFSEEGCHLFGWW